jgi:antirestriction protein ArdC
MGKRFGSAGYAMEELRAELSSAFIAGELGIPADIPQHTSYIANWLKPLKGDKREIFRAAADAQRIADMVLGFHPDFAAQPSRPDGLMVEAPPREPFVV